MNLTLYSHFSSIQRARIFTIIFFSACFLYIVWRIDPSLHYQCQIPIFLCDGTFFQNFIQYPGGLADYASNFLSQFYFYPLVGSLIVTACLVSASVLSFLILKTCASKFRLWSLHYVPPLLLLIMHSQYEHRLSFTLGLLASVLFFFLYLNMRPGRFTARFFLFIIQAGAIYYFSAGFVLLFGALCIFYELVYHRSYFFGILAAVFTGLLPYIAQAYVFIVTVKDAYFYLLIPPYDYRPAITPYLLLGYYPFLIFMVNLDVVDKISDRIPAVSDKKIISAVALLLAVIAVFLSFDAEMNTELRVDRYARNGQWDRLLDFVGRHSSDDVLVAFHTNRALAHTNRMPVEMFSYNQDWGTDGLYLPAEARKFFSIQVADFYWDMGFLNEAQHWLMEDHSRFEYSPWHLQRLALVSILKGENDLAVMALNALDKTILYRSWAKFYRRYIDNPLSIGTDPYLQSIMALNVENDFIINPSSPDRDVEALRSRNPANRMAFDYLMADYMLTFRLAKFNTLLKQIDGLNTQGLPRHYQEALLVYFVNAEPRDEDVSGVWVDARTDFEFKDFMRILNSHKGDALAAQKELKTKYGHTYWYYSLYNNPVMRERLANSG